MNIIPPQALDLEEVVLGAILIERDAFSRVANILNEDVFYLDKHKQIYKCCNNLFKNNQPIDLHTLDDELRRIGKSKEIGGFYYLGELTNKVASSANIEKHARIIVQKFIQREIIRISNIATREAYEDTTDVFDLLNTLQVKLMSINNLLISDKLINVYDSAVSHMLQAERVRSGEIESMGIKTNLNTLDENLRINKQDLVILAARPGMGKTALALSIAKNMSLNGNNVGIFSLEMGASPLSCRILSDLSEVEVGKIINATYNNEEFDKINKGLNYLKETNIYIDDNASVTSAGIRAKIMQMVQNKDIKFVIVDYIQLMTGDKGANREQQLATISRDLKKCAKEFDIPILVLAQLSRAVESRPDKMPQLSDLRESGAIEQDADIVLFIMRPEYYEIMQDEEGNSTENVAIINIAKYRNGKTRKIKIGFESKYTRFYDINNVYSDINNFDIF